MTHADPPSLEERRRDVREGMGGIERLERLRERGVNSARERIALLLDPDSFRELGTFGALESARGRRHHSR